MAKKTAKKKELKPASTKLGKKLIKDENQREKINSFASSTAFRVIIILIIVLVFFFCIIKAYQFGYNIFSDETMESSPGTEVTVLITDGMSDGTIADLLEQKGLISDTTVFKLQLSLFTSSSYGIVPGEYKLNTCMTAKEMITEMSGDLVTETTADEHLGLYD